MVIFFQYIQKKKKKKRHDAGTKGKRKKTKHKDASYTYIVGDLFVDLHNHLVKIALHMVKARVCDSLDLLSDIACGYGCNVRL